MSEGCASPDRVCRLYCLGSIRGPNGSRGHVDLEDGAIPVDGFLTSWQADVKGRSHSHLPLCVATRGLHRVVTWIAFIGYLNVEVYTTGYSKREDPGNSCFGSGSCFDLCPRVEVISR